MSGDQTNALIIAVHNWKAIETVFCEFSIDDFYAALVLKINNRHRHDLLCSYQFVAHGYLIVQEWKVLSTNGADIHGFIEDASDCKRHEECKYDWKKEVYIFCCLKHYDGQRE